MNHYRVDMYNLKNQLFDCMTIFAANLIAASEIALERLYCEWDDPEEWELQPPIQIR